MPDLRLVATLGLALALAAPTALAGERPVPPPPDVRGPPSPIPPRADPPQAQAPQAQPPVAEPPEPPAAPHGDHPSPTDHPVPASALPSPAAIPAPAAAAAPPPLAHPAVDAAEAASAVRALDRARAPAAPREQQPVPPSLTSKALAEELRRSAGGRATDKESLAAERARLEKLAKEIADARAALQVETTRLKELVAQAAAAPKGAHLPGKPGAKAPATPLDSLSRTVKGMRAEQAAALLARLDRPLAASLLERMKPGEAAGVMEKMDAAASAALVALLARKDAP